MGAAVEQPYASVILLTKNGSKTIARCLDSLFAQKTGSPFEVIAIDSGSTDGTVEIMGRYPLTLEKIPSEDFNFGATKNMGVGMSKGQIVVFLSQDAIPSSEDWLQNMVEPFTDPEIMVVQGLEVSADDGFYWWRIGHFWFTSEIRRWMERHQGVGLSCVSLAIRKTAFDRIRFDEVPFGEDKLLQKKALMQGFGIDVASLAIVEHTHRYTLRSLVQRLANEGLGARLSGGQYSFKDMLRDSSDRRIIRLLFEGLRSGRIRSIGEFIYPLLRPMVVYIGWGRAKVISENLKAQ